ncbi:hypothetical protein QVD17_22154 [Tagetes erecta]|uniref:Uncharacterized protein n=1 Tax=Tagetes erecta TaxID=13708 RepID=A0AAD8KF92_TARER|nr:hypothetical protein QVD17_22154 [Tagetes erecta]
MGNNQSNEHHTRSCCEKIHRATVGRLTHGPRAPKLKYAPLPTPVNANHVPFEVKVKPLNNFVQLSSNSEEVYTGYIDGMKKKMWAPPDVVGTTTTISHCDSFDDRVSSFISNVKVKFVATSSMGPGAKSP